jgi:outer membrane protein assembly factor BamB
MKKLAAIIFSILLVQLSIGQTRSDWYIFRGDPALQGITSNRLPDQPKLVWSFPAGDDLRSSPVFGSGRMVAGSMDGSVYCLDYDGQLKWKFETGNGVEAPALIHGGKVFVGDLDGSLYCLDLQSGKENWSYKADNQISGSPNIWVSGNRALIVFGSYDFYLHCLDAGTGKLIWKYETDNFINGAAACYQGKAIFGGCDGFIHVVDIATGKFEKKIDIATYIASSVAVSANAAFIGDHDGKFSCVDLENEKIVWTWTNDQARLPFLASPSVNQKVAVIGNEDKYTYCFNRFTGELIWRFNSGSRINASPVIAGDRVLVANMRGDLHILDITDGNALWTYELGSAITGNPAISSERFFIAAADGYIYCFGK